MDFEIPPNAAWLKKWAYENNSDLYPEERDALAVIANSLQEKEAEIAKLREFHDYVRHCLCFWGEDSNAGTEYKDYIQLTHNLEKGLIEYDRTNSDV